MMEVDTLVQPLRSTLLYLSESQRAYNLLMKLAISKKISARFVAGDTAAKAIDVARQLEERGFHTSLNLLGEGVKTPEQAISTTDSYITLLDTISQSGVGSNISVKPTNLGLSMGEDLCLGNLLRIAAKANETGNFIRFEMEGSQWTQPTLNVFYQALEQYGNIGIVIQAYLYRSEDDLREIISRGGTIRLVKGAYLEPSNVAIQKKADVDRNYKKLAEMLILSGGRHAFATQDEHIINYIRCFIRKHDLDESKSQFQMLYGVRRDLQERLLAEGCNTLVYLPFGTRWYPYFVRRLAERPANILFIVSSLAKESLPF
jgi:proline dehydrogenase